MGMARRIHLTLGLILSAVYLYIGTHVGTLLPGLDAAATMPGFIPRRGVGLVVAYGLPMSAIVCFLFAPQLKWRLSPRTPPLFDYLLSEGAFYIAGYGLLAVGIGVLLLFR